MYIAWANLILNGTEVLVLFFKKLYFLCSAFANHAVVSVIPVFKKTDWLANGFMDLKRDDVWINIVYTGEIQMPKRLGHDGMFKFTSCHPTSALNVTISHISITMWTWGGSSQAQWYISILIFIVYWKPIMMSRSPSLICWHQLIYIYICHDRQVICLSQS